MSGYVYDDGGRADAGYLGSAGDCVARALSIAFARHAGTVPDGDSYRAVYDELQRRQREWIDGTARTKAARRARSKSSKSVRDGAWSDAYRPLLDSLGWRWVPTMTIGSGTRVHLRADELPSGVIIARLSRHLCAVIDGEVHDTYDPSRGGTRAVYGYWTREP